MAYPRIFWNIIRQVPLALTIICLGNLSEEQQQIDPAKGEIVAGIFIGRMIIEFWCVIPIKAINLLFEYEIRRVINQRRSEVHVSFLLNENRIVVIALIGFLFLLIFMNINLYQQESIQIYSTREVGI